MTKCPWHDRDCDESCSLWSYGRPCRAEVADKAPNGARRRARRWEGAAEDGGDMAMGMLREEDWRLMRMLDGDAVLALVQYFSDGMEPRIEEEVDRHLVDGLNALLAGTIARYGEENALYAIAYLAGAAMACLSLNLGYQTDASELGALLDEIEGGAGTEEDE